MDISHETALLQWGGWKALHFNEIEPNESSLNAAIKKAGTALARVNAGCAAEPANNKEDDGEAERQSGEEAGSPSDGNPDIFGKVGSIIEEAEAWTGGAGAGRNTLPTYPSLLFRGHNNSRVHAQLISEPPFVVYRQQQKRESSPRPQAVLLGTFPTQWAPFRALSRSPHAPRAPNYMHAGGSRGPAASSRLSAR